jgi:hypothetical protein
VCIAETMNVTLWYSCGQPRRKRHGSYRWRAVAEQSDVDALARQFLNSDYVGGMYAKAPLDKRLSNFLRHSGMGAVADNGDLYNIILDRVMAGITKRPGTETSRRVH